MIGKLSFILFSAIFINQIYGLHRPVDADHSKSLHPKPPPHKPPHHPIHPEPHTCRLKGWWENKDHELTLYINEDIPRGFTITFDGFFFKNDRQGAPIIGVRTRRTTAREEGTFGFVASFPAAGTAVWVGQCYHVRGHDALETIMLHRYVADRREFWLATRVASLTWTKRDSPPAWYTGQAN